MDFEKKRRRWARPRMSAEVACGMAIISEHSTILTADPAAGALSKIDRKAVAAALDHLDREVAVFKASRAEATR